LNKIGWSKSSRRRRPRGMGDVNAAYRRFLHALQLLDAATAHSIDAEQSEYLFESAELF